MSTPRNDAIEAIPESQCLALLRNVVIGRLGVTTDDGGVDLFPVNFVVDRGEILFRTAAGTKLERIEENPKVAFETDHFDWYERTAWSVVVKGEATIVHERDDLIDLFEVDVLPWHADPKPYFVRLLPDSITGRRFRVSPSRHP